MKTFLVLMTALVLSVASMTACTSTGNGNGIRPLEQMSELEYSKWKLYIQLGVKIGATRALTEGVITRDQLDLAAVAIESIKGTPIEGGAKSLIMPALQKAGFTNDEVELVLLVAEQELIARGALNWINPQTNVLELSPRTQEMLTVIADALRMAGNVTAKEKAQSEELRADFSRPEFVLVGFPRQ